MKGSIEANILRGGGHFWFLYFFDSEILRLAKAGCRRRLPTFSGSQAQLTCFQGEVWAPRRGQGKRRRRRRKKSTGLRSRRQGALPLPLPLLRCSNDVFSPSFPPFSLSLFVTFLQRLSRDSPLAPHFVMYYPIQNIERTIRIRGGGISCIISLCFRKGSYLFLLVFFCVEGGLVTACFSRI